MCVTLVVKRPINSCIENNVCLRSRNDFIYRWKGQRKKKSHLPCARHELAVIVKDSTSINDKTVQNKASESPRSELQVNCLLHRTERLLASVNEFSVLLAKSWPFLKMQAMFFFFVCMILVTACKDKEKKKITPFSRAARIRCLCKKKVTSVVNRNLKTKQQSNKAFIHVQYTQLESTRLRHLTIRVDPHHRKSRPVK